MGLGVYAFLCIIGFVLMGYDKYLSIQFAKHHGGYRIPEKTLMLFACLGGIGVWIGMYVFHHKTRKPKFYIGVPVLCILTLLAWQGIMF